MVTGAAQGGPRAPGALAPPARPLGGSGGDASCRSSFAGGAAWSRGATARAAVKRGHPYPSSPPLPVSSPVCVPLHAGFGTIFLPATMDKLNY